jgi:hypothetical protein
MTWQLGGYGGAEVAIRESNCQLSQILCESPFLLPLVPQGHCHPWRQRGISFSYTITIKNRPSKNIL